MDPNSNPLPQQPDNSNPGGQPVPPQPGQQFAPQPQQPGSMVASGSDQSFQPQPQPQFNQQPQQPFAPQPDGGYPTGMPSPNKSKMRLVVVLVSVLVVAALAAVSYFAFFKSDETADKAAKKSSNNSQVKEAIDMATLQDLDMSLASAPQGYTAKSDPAPGAKQFTSSGSDDKETCDLIFGVFGADVLPGNNLDEIIKPQIDQLREFGASISGPQAGNALTVKSATGGDLYKMPTLNFTFSYQGSEAVVHYSAVILKSGKRAIVNRTCAQKDGTVNQSRLTSLDNASKSIAVTKK